MDVEIEVTLRATAAKKGWPSGAATIAVQRIVTRHAEEKTSTKMKQSKLQKDKKSMIKIKRLCSRSVIHFSQTILK